MIGCAAMAATAIGRFSDARSRRRPTTCAMSRRLLPTLPGPRSTRACSLCSIGYIIIARRSTTISIGSRISSEEKAMKERYSRHFGPTCLRGSGLSISGGTSGIGLALAKGFARLGAETIATGASAARFEAARADAEATAMSASSASTFATGRPSTRSSRRCRSLDVLVNSAGVAKPEARIRRRRNSST